MTVADDDAAPDFEPLEWAVLVNGIGGRLFRVWKTFETPGGVKRVEEWHDTTKRPHSTYGSFDVNAFNLIKVPNKATAEAVVELLVEVFDRGDRLYRQAKFDRDNAVGRAETQIREMLKETTNG